MRPLLIPLALGFAAFAAAQYPGALPPPEGLKKGFEAVHVKDAKRILGYLAGPECQGRGTGQPGYAKAAAFMAARFREAGLRPMGDGGTYFQNATFYLPTVRDARLRLGKGETAGEKEFRLNATGRDVDLTGSVVLVRTSAGALPTDAQLAALRGRIAIVTYPPGSRALPLADRFVRAETKALVEAVDRIGPSQERASMQDPSRVMRRPLGQITHRALAALDPRAERFFAAPGTGVELLELSDEARLRAGGGVERSRVPNVVGMVEGSDPDLMADVVGVGAHLDHLGVNADGVVYPGADDDGSGSTALVLIAKAIAANPVKPKRSILFMAFFGEEKGLLGSHYLVDHPPVPLVRMVAELQMDMVGRDSDGPQNGDPNRIDRRAENVDTLRLVGTHETSMDLDADVLEANRAVGFRIKRDGDDVYRRSDHYSFAQRGIPVAFLFDGFHPDYHQPTDTVDKIDWTKLTNTARLGYLILMRVANDPAAPRKGPAPPPAPNVP